MIRPKSAPMPYAEFKEIFSDSASIYLDYLTFVKPLDGCKVVSIQRIEQLDISSMFRLITTEKVHSLEGLEVWVKGKHISSIQALTIGAARGGVSAIRVSDDGGYLRDHPCLSPHDIQVVSDLRFLIKRLNKFYSSRSFGFKPPSPKDLPELPFQYMQRLSSEQLDAIEGVFRAPISYVNGAPGTGKTRMVLSRCVLRYILTGKRVFLLAPTNNAVEQMLRSILPILEDAGIPLEKVYRLGTSSSVFAEEYPQVVCDTSLEALQTSLIDQRDRLLSQISDSQFKHAELQEEIQTLTGIARVHDALSELFSQLQSSQIEFADAVSSEAQLAQNLKDLKTEFSYAIAKEAKITTEFNACEQLIESIRSKIDTISYRVFKRKKREQLISQLNTLNEDLEKLRLDRTAASIQVQDLSRDYSTIEVRYKASCTVTNRIRRHCVDTLPLMIDEASKGCPHCHPLMRSLLASPKPSLSPLADHFTSIDTTQLVSEQQQLQRTICDLQKELDEILTQLKDVAGKAKSRQRDEALVLCGTVDASLGYLRPPEPNEPHPIAHVFLDEAGYTSLARGMAALSCKVPVTFLGDHKQLPPVCVMDPIPDKDKSVCLWALSVAYLPEFIYGGLDKLYYDHYCRSTEPSFIGVSYFSLNTSYRFGPMLADVLAKHIYSKDFRGNTNATFEVLVLDAPHVAGPMPRTSRSEVDSISEYLRIDPTEDVAILSPYRNQIKLLRQVLPRQYKDSILTVHRSQGREWDTVILSVTDTVKPYFTDSTYPIGRSVLCTAISRTKRKLILACDASVWHTQRNQIIADLIRLARSVDDRPIDPIQ